MPEISRFYGIVIKMYFDDHAPPHFHAYYSGQMAVININTLAVISGSFPLGLWAWWSNGRHSIVKSFSRFGRGPATWNRSTRSSRCLSA